MLCCRFAAATGGRPTTTMRRYTTVFRCCCFIDCYNNVCHCITTDLLGPVALYHFDQCCSCDCVDGASVCGGGAGYNCQDPESSCTCEFECPTVRLPAAPTPVDRLHLNFSWLYAYNPERVFFDRPNDEQFPQIISTSMCSCDAWVRLSHWTPVRHK